MSEHRGVSAAEKYAELEKAGASRPRCSCHGLEMGWGCDNRHASGGYWRCIALRREHGRRWREANPERSRESTRRWGEANPEKNKERNRRWREANPENYLNGKRRWRENNSDKIAASNSRRLYAGEMYLGTCGFNQTEVEMMLSGTSE